MSNAEPRCLMNGPDCERLTFRVTVPALAEGDPVKVFACLNPEHLGHTVAGVMRNKWQLGVSVEYIDHTAGRYARRDMDVPYENPEGIDHAHLAKMRASGAFNFPCDRCGDETHCRADCPELNGDDE